MNVHMLAFTCDATLDAKGIPVILGYSVSYNAIAPDRATEITDNIYGNMLEAVGQNSFMIEKWGATWNSL